ncbi:Dam family site-specific DNA-(adenine-N6)-methyltransferase [Rheinheimera maricola]|uniref:Dam family site-specific DNA-(adenine-N6)-methyltransferase n=1 Tax=Rheinheimera maricola TaxID=2793282 RepID=UPI001FD81A06|nr:Dam family site-specific DNA-(adenine-N6)-methyltransferase [Rheinheimera maricola]
MKWAGGKYHLVDSIQRHLPDSGLLIEPFVGAGSVFLNTDYPSYHLNDINADLINLYKLVKKNSQRFVDDAKSLFVASTNQREAYIALRQQFNQSTDAYERALLFLYLNRHGYNGLCRYNLSGKFNVPFGSYKKPYFPQAELYFFAEKAQRAEFSCTGYQHLMQKAAAGSVIYCDPPYVPLSKTASFTSYAQQGFDLDDQAQLANLAEQAQQRGATVVISNHDTTWTRKIYQLATLYSLQVNRSISQKGATRGKVAELFAVFEPMQAPSSQPVSVLPQKAG